MNPKIDWHTRMGNEHHTGYVNDVFVPPLRLAWKKHRGGSWSGPLIVGNRVYITGKYLQVLDLESGRRIWRSEQVMAWGLNSAAIADGLIFVAGDDYLFGIDAETGKTQIKLEGGIRDASPYVHRGMVYWAVLPTKLYAAEIGSSTLKWVYEVKNSRSSTKFTPVALDSSIFCASSGYVYALDALTGEVQWEHRFEGDLELVDPFDTAAIYEDKLIVPIIGAGMFAFDVKSGAIRWQSAFPPHTAPSVAEGVVYFGGVRRVCAVSAQTGETIWTNPNYTSTRSAPIVVRDYLFMGGDTHRKIYGFNRYTGEKIWDYPTDDLVFSTPAYAYGRLVIGSHDRYVYCFEEA